MSQVKVAIGIGRAIMQDKFLVRILIQSGTSFVELFVFPLLKNSHLAWGRKLSYDDSYFFWNIHRCTLLSSLRAKNFGGLALPYSWSNWSEQRSLYEVCSRHTSVFLCIFGHTTRLQRAEPHHQHCYRCCCWWWWCLSYSCTARWLCFREIPVQA